MRALVDWLLGRPQLTRLEALREIEKAPVIQPHADRKVLPFRNLLVIRDRTRRVA